MIDITYQWLDNPKNRPALRPRNDRKYFLREFRGIVVHWTANIGRSADADNNMRYFNNNKKSYGSAHFCVDDIQIVQGIPIDEVAYHANDRQRVGKNYKRRKQLLQGARNANFYTVGIEMCVNIDSDWKKVIDNTTDLIAQLMCDNGLTIEDIYRHYDITGKDCPKMLLPTVVGDKLKEWNWEMFLFIIEQKYKILDS